MKSTLFILFFAASAAHGGSISVESSLKQHVQGVLGQTHKGTIVVRNPGTEAQEVVAYQRDYRFFADGTNQYGAPGSLPRSNSTWMTFSPQQFVVQPGATRTVTWQMRVPEDATLNGTYWSVLMVEPATRFRPADVESGVSVRTVLRYAVQITATVGDEPEEGLAFQAIQAVERDGQTWVQVDLENTGEVGLEPATWMEILGSDGRSAGRVEGGQKGIYPGCSVRHEIPLPRLAAGQYTALIVANNQDDYVVGAKLVLDIR